MNIDVVAVVRLYDTLQDLERGILDLLGEVPVERVERARRRIDEERRSLKGDQLVNVSFGQVQSPGT